MLNRVDLKNWDRIEAFKLFSKMKDKFFGISFNVDVTNLYNFVKANNLSFYKSLVWCSTKSINSIPNFLYVYKRRKVYRVDKRIPSYTDMLKGSDNFKIITPMEFGDIFEFNKLGQTLLENQTSFINQATEILNLIYFSCIPWLDVTEIRSEGLLGKNDSIPRIYFGKYKEIDGRKIINISMDVNHMFIDGIHIAKFKEELDNIMNNL